MLFKEVELAFELTGLPSGEGVLNGPTDIVIYGMDGTTLLLFENYLFKEPKTVC